MPKRKTKKKKMPATEAAAPAADSSLPAPERVAKASVGEVVQDFVSFGGATSVEAHQEDSGTWLVRATA